MENLDIVKILGVGISGFGFLLMFLAYRLINDWAKNPNPNPVVLKAIKWYMSICFVMTITVGVFTFISSSYKTKIIEDQAIAIETKSDALNILTASQINDQLVDSMIRNSSNEDVALVINEQKPVLDTLSKYISKQNDPQLDSQFNKYRESVVKLSDSLTMQNIGNEKFKTLKAQYIRLNDSISKFSLRLANKKEAEGSKSKE
ncbi:MAG: hypothetical protein IPO62_17165 [Saprospiraceae bacterium]|nr:hypothetical protein [Saprospiraceae bacterium]MBK9632756.1 hypothetical protein [Saprospiraceae bacterium]